jgi:hypothetical protein
MIEPINLLIQIILMIGSAILGSYLTYYLSIKQSTKEMITAERVKLYKPILDFIDDFTEPHSQDEWNSLQKKVNEVTRRLYLYAPDHIVTAFLETMKKVEAGTKAKPFVEFAIVLRREIVSNTSLTSDDVISVQLRPKVSR